MNESPPCLLKETNCKELICEVQPSQPFARETAMPLRYALESKTDRLKSS